MMIPKEKPFSPTCVACKPWPTTRALIHSHWLVLILFAMLWVPGGFAVGQNIKWSDATSFEIEGKGWTKTAGPFDRLPDSAKDKVSPSVWGLGKNSAGIAVRFLTDATTVSVRWSLTSDSLAMPHMPATGVSGVDL
jgi:hypothetical protein